MATKQTKSADFIPNIDDANAEVSRLNTALADETQKAEKAAADLVTANEKLTKAESDLAAANTKVTDLTAANEKATADLAAANEKVTKLETDLAAANSKATKTIAKAGVDPVGEQGKTNPNADDPLKGLTGLQRAIEANRLKHEAAK